MMNDPTLENLFQGDLPVVRWVSQSLMMDPICAQKTATSKHMELIHVVAGSMELITEAGCFPAGPGDTLLVPSQTPHRDQFDPDVGLRAFFISFSWESESAYLELVSNPMLAQLPPHSRARIARAVEQMRTDLPDCKAIDEWIMRTRLTVTLLTLFREVERNKERNESSQPKKEGKNHQRAIMRQAKDYLNEHYSEVISLEDVAQALHISAFRLSHIFSEESEFTLFSYLTHLRMRMAISLLRQGDLNVAEVGAAVGYKDSNYFSKAFKRHVGDSPRHFLRISKTATDYL